MVCAEVKQTAVSCFWGEACCRCLGFGFGGTRFEVTGLAGGGFSRGCDGKQDGRSQHKTVSSRSCDSGVEQPRISKGIHKHVISQKRPDNMGCLS